MGALIEIPDQAALHGDPDDQHDGNREKNGNGHREIEKRRAEITEPDFNIRLPDFHRRAPWRHFGRIDRHHLNVQNGLDRHRAESTQHEQGTVREVHHAERAEDNGQAKRDQGIGPALIETV